MSGGEYEDGKALLGRELPRGRRLCIGGPLDGQAIRGSSLVRGPDGEALPASAGDAAMARASRGRPLHQEHQVYIRQGQTYLWVPPIAERKAQGAPMLSGGAA